MVWPNWDPPEDLEIGGDRVVAPPAPPPGIGPDTDLLLGGEREPGVDPIRLLPPYRLAGNNAAIPAKGVMGVGPQSGDAGNIFYNNGTLILPGWQRYLEMGSQLQVGIQPRTVPVQNNQLWDADFVLNPAIEVT